MKDTRRSLLDKSFETIREYLNFEGWKSIDDPMNNDWMQLICPDTERTHDLDYAFTLQLERNRIKLCNKNNKETTKIEIKNI